MTMPVSLLNLPLSQKVHWMSTERPGKQQARTPSSLRCHTLTNQLLLQIYLTANTHHLGKNTFEHQIHARVNAKCAIGTANRYSSRFRAIKPCRQNKHQFGGSEGRGCFFECIGIWTSLNLTEWKPAGHMSVQVGICRFVALP